MTYYSLAVEDDLSDGVVRRLLRDVRPGAVVHASRVTSGFGQLKKNILAFNNAAKAIPQLVLTDLDHEECAPALVTSWMGAAERHPRLWFRVAVKEIEAWLLAHRQAVAQFLGIQINLVPHNPEELNDPKASLIQLARYCTNRGRRRAIVPKGVAVQGPDYNRELLEFVMSDWNPEVARQTAPSLHRAMIRLATL